MKLFYTNADGLVVQGEELEFKDLIRVFGSKEGRRQRASELGSLIKIYP